MATKKQIIERLKLGERLFEKVIVSQMYSKYDDMEWFIYNVNNK